MVLLGSVLVTKTCTQQLQQHCERCTAMHAQEVVACATCSWTRITLGGMQQKGHTQIEVAGRCNEHHTSIIDKQSDLHYRDSLLISCSDSRLRAGDDSSRLRSHFWVSRRKHGCPLPVCRNSVTYNHQHSLSRPLCMHKCLCQAALSTRYNHLITLSHKDPHVVLAVHMQIWQALMAVPDPAWLQVSHDRVCRGFCVTGILHPLSCSLQERFL